MGADDVIAERTGRRALRLPSNRLGLYLSLRHWCTPGQRLLMSPFSADEILFLVLAAGLIPVMAPLSPLTGNMDLALAGLDAVDAILTTNLYGLPDDMPLLSGRTVIEDVAHAAETSLMGVPLGAFGVAGVFSLSKHARAGSGGVLVVDDRADLDELSRHLDLLLEPGSLRREIVGVTSSMARLTALRLGLVRPALRLSRALGLEEERSGYRIGVRPGDLAATIASADPASAAHGLPPFDPWVRADLHGYRVRQGALTRWYQDRRASRLPEERLRRLEGVRRLAELPAVAPGVRAHLDQPLFRVPLLVADRDEAIAKLERRGVVTGYLYDPPYDDYAPGFAEPSPHPDAARWWARHVLPVDPLHADRALPVIEKLLPAPPPPPAPAAPPPGRPRLGSALPQSGSPW